MDFLTFLITFCVWSDYLFQADRESTLQWNSTRSIHCTSWITTSNKVVKIQYRSVNFPLICLSFYQPSEMQLDNRPAPSTDGHVSKGPFIAALSIIWVSRRYRFKLPVCVQIWETYCLKCIFHSFYCHFFACDKFFKHSIHLTPFNFVGHHLWGLAARRETLLD